MDNLSKEVHALLDEISSLTRPTTSGQEAEQPSRKRPRRAFTLEEIDQLIADYRAGMPMSELTTRYRCHRAVVLKYTSQAGVHRKAKGKVSQQALTEMVRLYESGLGTGDIGRRLGFTTKTVRRRLKTVGVMPGPVE
ncbi:hypothetical protein [Citricoccus muralis]|uniref:Helix-turn-helix resolvase-like protein n=1 Tax=Citricoccus muralis TaxID=169134 RepID=A0ABY8H357_9MICC|nr:hypothetical protein [Citricoccus muralis]WFP15561.1 hypothetical protein P8192_09080 [Citricoccus muralis]